MATYSHKIKATELVSGIMERSHGWEEAQIHKAGCNHTKKMTNIRPFSIEENEPYLDDYYVVAPCAR